MAKIQVLPVELVQLILLYYVEESFATESNETAIRGMLAVTSVCSHWRGAALGFPALWFPVCTSRWRRWKITDLFLKRGLSAPIRITTADTRLPISPRLLIHLERIQELDLTAPGTNGLDPFMQTFGENFPNLLSLRISSDPSVFRENTVVHIKCPKLTSLTLHNTMLHSFEDITKLVHLSLRSDTHYVTVSCIISILATNPALETIGLQTMSFPGSESELPLPVLELPALIAVSLNVYLVDLLSLLRAISPSITPSTALTASIRGRMLLSNLMFSLEPCLQLFLPYTSCSVCIDDGTSIQCKSQRRHLQLASNSSTSSSNVLSLMSLHIPFHLISRISHIHLELELAIKEVDFLWLYPLVTRISVSYTNHSTLSHFAAALRRKHQQKDIFILPILGKMTIRVPATNAESFDERDAETWLRLFRRRNEQGYERLKRLRFELVGKEVDAHLVQKFEEVVGIVTFVRV